LVAEDDLPKFIAGDLIKRKKNIRRFGKFVSYIYIKNL